MDNKELQKWVGVNDLTLIRSLPQTQSGWEIMFYEYQSISKNLNVKLWHSTKGLSFYKVLINDGLNTYLGQKDVRQLDLELFWQYYSSIDLSDDQLNLVVDYLENLISKIKIKYDQYLQVPVQLRRNGDILRMTLTGHLKDYLKAQEVLTKYDNHSLVGLFQIFAPTMNYLLTEFKLDLETPPGSLAQRKHNELYDSLFKEP